MASGSLLSTDTVQAAGGVLWRPGPDGIEVAVIHRPRYDDWSLPKGKLDPGEHRLEAALREVREETGFTATPGRRLGTSDYRVLLRGQETSKTVYWWAMRVGDGAFVPGVEVDQLLWLAPERALARVSTDRDTEPLRRLTAGPLETATVLLVRHARAGSKADWAGPDEQRPLDETGQAQAVALSGLLAAYGVHRVLSAPVLRCRSTVEPLAARLGLEIEVDEALGEHGFAESPERACQRVLALAGQPGATVICAQGGALPDLVVQLAAAAGMELAGARARKGSVWALSMSQGLLVDADYVPDPLDA